MTTESTSLIALEDISAEDILSNEDKAHELVGQIRAIAEEAEHDPNTPEGRADIKSLALKVSKSKTAVVGRIDERVAGLKAEVKAANGVLRIIKEGCDQIRDEVKAPVIAIEEAQKARERAYADLVSRCRELSAPEYGETLEGLKGRLEALADINPNAVAEEFAPLASKAHQAAIDKLAPIVLDAERAAAAAAEEAERLRAAEAERADREAAERAEREAEAEVEAERLATENARLAAEKEETDRREAERQAEIDEAKRAQAEAEAEVERTRQEAIDRQRAIDEQAEAEAKEKAAADAAEEKRAANVKHRRKVNVAARDAIVEACMLTEEQAEAVVKAIAMGVVPATTIKY